MVNVVFPSPNVTRPGHLAYIEWFSPIQATRDPTHQMYRVSRLTENGQRLASVCLLSGFCVAYTYFLDLGKLYPQTGILLRYWSIVVPSILTRLQVDTVT